MIKNLAKILISILILFLIFIAYFSYFGIKTSKFNSTIKDQIKKQNDNLDIDLKKVKLHLDLKNISIKIKTKNPKIILKDLDEIKLDEISSNISISSYFQNKFVIKNLSIKSKNNEISSYINFYTHTNNSLKLILLNQFLKRGMAQINIDLNFDDSGKIKKDYSLTGKVSNAEIQIPKYKSIRNLNFTFNAKDKYYKFEKILFKFNEINLNSNFLEIKKQKDKFVVKGNLKNKKDKINNDLIFLIFNDNLKNFDFSNTKFESISDFSFDINKRFKIKNLKIDSKLNLDEFLLKYDLYKIKNFIKNYNSLIKLKDSKINIKYSRKEFLIDGSSEFYIEKDFKNLLNFKIKKRKHGINFETFFNLKNVDLKFDDISYNKIIKNHATLKIKGSQLIFLGKPVSEILFKNINYTEDKNTIEINNLKIDSNKILDIDLIKLNYLTTSGFKNEIALIKKNKNFELRGKSFDSIQLIENISNSETDKNFFQIFKPLYSKIKININEVKLDEANIVNNLNGNLEIKNNKIFDLNLNSNFTRNEKLFISIKTHKDNTPDREIVTTFYSDRAKPFVKKYKFIKGFEEGNLDFSSKKINNVSKSKLIIDNFKVKEIPVLAKILSLASLQGIADLLTGEGVRFTDFEMIYSNKGSLMTIDEIYAIGPAISIMMEGYVESKKLVSLRGTLVPATTINRTISSIPFLGDLLVGKKVGEGVFGVSFKIKGPPKDLKTKVNPIKTLTPRFITRTLEKIKKN
jgi:hypothetical protein|tara:strand:+ start:518 stop:2752 length:2235 start_codon:yes stop_codon:yes gene_type:complete